MSHRCSAKGCFNSSIACKGKQIKFFGFPKHEDFAHRWAMASGREDLTTKPLKTIIKYYLCSEHFHSDCFDLHGRLLRNLPHSIAIPSKFENNFNEVVELNMSSTRQVVNNVMVIRNEMNPEDDLDPIDALSERDVDCLGYEQDPTLEEVRTCRLCGHEFQGDECEINIFSTGPIQQFVERIMSNEIKVTDPGSKIACVKCLSEIENCLRTIQRIQDYQNTLTLELKATNKV